MSGLFVTFEGGDGVGKTTQATALEEWLQASGRSVGRTREPGGTEVGVLLRDIVLHHRGEAARAQHIATVVRPALARGDVVIQDRYLDSSVAYQGAGREIDPGQIRDLSLWAADGLLPDVTVLLDLDHAAARRRLDADDKPFDRLESERSDFHDRVRQAFLDLAAAESERFLVVDASLPAEDIAQTIRSRVATALAAGVGEPG